MVNKTTGNSAVWGGEWTEEKLDTFTKYVNAYLTIMNTNRDRWGWELVYFDGFAGSGSRIDENDSSSPLLLELFNDNIIQRDEINIYKSAAERVLSITQRGFDYYYFIDRDRTSNLALEEKLLKYKSSDKKLIFRCDDANIQVKLMADSLKKKHRLKSLALLDPFGMQVNWKSIASLKGTHTDLWILIPTGVIVNRLLDRKGELTHTERLCSFFGLSETEIKDYFYKKEVETTLFGDSEIIFKVEKPIQKIAELYIERLKTIFTYVTEEPLVMYNTRNIPIFHFAFASISVH